MPYDKDARCLGEGDRGRRGAAVSWRLRRGGDDSRRRRGERERERERRRRDDEAAGARRLEALSRSERPRLLALQSSLQNRPR